MPVQRSQGRRRPQVPRSDELAEGVPAPVGELDPAKAAALAVVSREPDGRVADSASAAALGSLGGRAKAERDRMPALVRRLGLREVTAADFLPYLADAEDFAEAECQRLALLYGGGECGFGPSSMVQSAALDLAGSRCAYARGDLTTGSRLAAASRANLMSARDECARDAERRPKRNGRGRSVLDEPEPRREATADASSELEAPEGAGAGEAPPNGNGADES